MDTTILIGLILFTFALLVYSIATWAGVISGNLKKWHLILFWIGFIADLSGTLAIGSVYGKFVQNTHSYLGAIALLAVLAQNIAATIILLKVNTKWIPTFPKKISLPVWAIWTASYIAGLILSGGSR
ncbi:MAG: hypothetical protein J7L35_11980 [Anaerolineales bacterium]|nr:hypothetical protein [Anaerolineales bacterium]